MHHHIWTYCYFSAYHVQFFDLEVELFINVPQINAHRVRLYMQNDKYMYILCECHPLYSS